MNFDQKAVKFLANFYINGGRHWTHGPLRLTPLLLPQPVHRTVVLLNLKQHPREEAWFQQSTGPRQQMLSWPVTTQVLQKQLLGQRPPILMDPDVPGPTTYEAADASIREPSSHPNFSIGCRAPTHESQGSRVQRGRCLQSKSPVLQSTVFLREPKEAPAQTPKVGKRLNSTARDILPCCCLQSLWSPPFSRRRSCSSCTPDPATYRTEDCDKMCCPSAPGVAIQGVQRSKPQDKSFFCAT